MYLLVWFLAVYYVYLCIYNQYRLLCRKADSGKETNTISQPKVID